MNGSTALAKASAFSYSFNPSHTKLFRTVRCQGCTHVYCTPIPEHIDAN